MMQPLISIVLPTYNGSKYLALSIESCLSQSYTNWELIIVDDCSTDNTPQIIESFKTRDPRIKSTRNEHNKKLPMSLNAGFALGTGEYFTWTSDDNYYASHALETLLSPFLSDPSIGLVYSNYQTIDDQNKITGSKIFGDVNKNMVEWKGCGACFLYKRDLHFDLKGYDPSAFLIEDYDFFVRALTKVRFIYLERSDLYFYRFHGGSLTSLYGFYNFDLQKIVIERQLPALMNISSQREKALWMRKFAVYYGVSKNNGTRMKYYLGELSKFSLAQLIITSGYIVVKKIETLLNISWAVLTSIPSGLFKPFGKKEKSKIDSTP
jgi:glycosyltransferase involved in cell wall biosynthesis